ncbi:hypothetical protein [Alkaliphilus crotonatoxidans]
MGLSIHKDFFSNVNRMFDNLSLNKDYDNEAQREEFVSRAISLKEAGIDITETSKITASFFREFSNVSRTTTIINHEEWLEALGKRYVEMRDELHDMYIDNENELYRQLDRLNDAFQQSLNDTCLMPAYSYKTVEAKIVAFTEDQDSERIQFEEAAARAYAECEEYNKNVQNIMDNFRKNMLRHVDTFYENFIQAIQTKDFTAAYQESMTLLKNSKTTAYNEISYSDMLRIKDVINNVPTEFDEQGYPTKMRYNTADESFRALLQENSVSYSVRKTIADIFNFYI